MVNFEICAPTRIMFGKETHLNVGIEVAKYGRKALVVYGGERIKANGLYESIENSLKQEGIAVVALGGVKPNPRLSLVQDGISICREHGVNFILAVGGGSTIDTAKAIAMGVEYNGDI